MKIGEKFGNGIVVHVFCILHDGWEMDNEGWVIVEDGKMEVWATTTHGWKYEMKLSQLDAKIAEMEKFLDGLKLARKLIS